MNVERWTLASARDRIAALEYETPLGAGAGLAAIIVDVGDDPADDVGSALTQLPLVAIALGAGGASWDIATDDLAPLSSGLEVAPRAAVVAAQVLRGTAREERTLTDGLLVESLAYAALQGGPDHGAWLQVRAQRSDGKVKLPQEDDHGPDCVIINDDDNQVAITLNRPHVANAFNAAMRDQLADALRAARADTAHRPILIRGAGNAFCSGGDLTEFGTVADPSTAHLLRSSTAVAPLLTQVAGHTTAFIDGACVGAGIELAAFCHRIEATPRARFRLPEVSMGLIPGVGGTVSIPRRIGRQRTLEWLISNRELDTTTALSWGLVDAIVDN